jgi:hypothetical protein
MTMATLPSQTTLKVGDSPQKRTRGGQIISNVARAFFALGYLVGSMVHVRFAVTNNHVYEAFGKTALIPGFQKLWSSVVMPNITFFALLLAAFEMMHPHPEQGQIHQNRLGGQCALQFVPRAVGSCVARSRLESRRTRESLAQSAFRAAAARTLLCAFR